MSTNLDYLIVKDSRNGKGIFTTKDITAKDEVYEVSGKFMTVAEVESEGILSPLSANTYRFSRDLYLSPSGTIGDFLNHSCEPNSYIKKEGDHLYVCAINNISAGSEILIDYSTIMAPDDSWSMECNCDAKLCRGKIERFVSLPEQVQELYRSIHIVPEYILNM